MEDYEARSAVLGQASGGSGGGRISAASERQPAHVDALDALAQGAMLAEQIIDLRMTLIGEQPEESGANVGRGSTPGMLGHLGDSARGSMDRISDGFRALAEIRKAFGI